MSLAKWLIKNTNPETVSKIKSFSLANKKPLMAAASIPVAYGAYEVAQPAIDDFMTDQAIESMKRSAKNAIVDTADYAAKHPYMASALLGGSGVAGATMGADNFAKAFDSISPFKISNLVKSRESNRR